MRHELKTDKPVFEAMLRGDKPWEIRFDDRNFQVGDTLLAQETQHTGEEMKPQHDGGYPGATSPGMPLIYTGRELELEVIYKLSAPIYGLMDGWCIMSVKILKVINP